MLTLFYFLSRAWLYSIKQANVNAIATFWKSNNSNNSLLKQIGKTIPYFLSHSYQSLIIRDVNEYSST